MASISKFSGGYSPDEQVGPAGSFKVGRNLNIRERVDSLTCGNKMLQVSGLDNEKVNVYVNTGALGVFAFCASGKIYYSSNPNGASWTLSYTDSDGQIRGASLFNDASNTYLYWIVGDTTAKKLKKSVISTTLTPSTIVSWTANVPSDYNMMKQVLDRMFFCNSNDLGMVSLDGTYQLAVESAPFNLIFNCLEESNGFLMAGMINTRGGDTFIKTISIVGEVGTIKNIPIKATKVECIINGGKDIIAMAGGVLYLCNTSDAEPIQNIGLNSSPHATVGLNNIPYFGLYKYATTRDEGVFSYGRKDAIRSKALNLDFYLGDNIQEIYSMSVGLDNNLIVSFNDGGINKTFYENINLKADGVYETLDIYSPDTITAPVSYKLLKGIMAPLPTGCSIKAYYQKDKKGVYTPLITNTNNTAIFNTVNATEFVFPVNENSDIMSIKLELFANGLNCPRIYKLNII